MPIPKTEALPVDQMTDLERQVFTQLAAESDLVSVFAESLYVAILQKPMLAITAWWISEQANVMFFVLGDIQRANLPMLLSICEGYRQYRTSREMLDALQEGRDATEIRDVYEGFPYQIGLVYGSADSNDLLNPLDEDGLPRWPLGIHAAGTDILTRALNG